MVEGAVDVAVLLPPRAGAGVQGGLDRRVEAMELALEHVAKEMVVPVPLAPSVERHEEQVRSLELVEPLGRIGALEHGVTDAGREAIEHR